MAGESFQTIQVEREGPVCSIALHKPPLNIMDLAMIQEILTALDRIESDPAVRVIVFRGAGAKGFSAGVSVQDHTPERIRQVIPAFGDIFRRLSKTDKVTVAAVHGFCLGGGLELVLMCDLVVAAEKAQFGQPEIKLGQIAPVGLILLPRLIGSRKAAELLFTGCNVDAVQAHSLGLVNRVVSPENLAPCLEGLLNELTALSGTALRLTKRMLCRLAAPEFERQLQETEQFFLRELAETEDAKEGIFAFLEKRPPRWTHR